MTITLYYSPASSQCQAIQMVAAALGLELELKVVDVQGGEHLKPEFIKLNPQHTIPTLTDDEFSVWETRAILVYLIEKYGKPNDPLYPSDARLRATINQRLYFDMGTLYQTFFTTYIQAIRSKTTLVGLDVAKVDTVFGFLDTFLEGADFVAGTRLTVADIALFTTVSLYELVGYDWAKNANVSRWYTQLRKTVPGREINEAGMEVARKRFINK